ncbi:hypothetical protein BDV37DRAFT_165493 [Aspergillus pseudonomiae]|uniref:Uncharacterized protein n=1 Tax=Aspergillus pseudonomiae TaxID=1506151 RepID=A0A5N7D6X8_9EURO|nr:uncharacterized protein BDV37DRAFT_165493 [Aspergillus pseudonomiae]KAE8402085.1 hypothetical protein BDV37DRAFT_165493 [Aspergillus pseudonomiae]
MVYSKAINARFSIPGSWWSLHRTSSWVFRHCWTDSGKHSTVIVLPRLPLSLSPTVDQSIGIMRGGGERTISGDSWEVRAGWMHDCRCGVDVDWNGRQRIKKWNVGFWFQEHKRMRVRYIQNNPLSEPEANAGWGLPGSLDHAKPPLHTMPSSVHHHILPDRHTFHIVLTFINFSAWYFRQLPKPPTRQDLTRPEQKPLPSWECHGSMQPSRCRPLVSVSKHLARGLRLRERNCQSEQKLTLFPPSNRQRRG